MKKYRAIGLMSGSSLDGLDLAAVDFAESNGRWSFNILAAECLDYKIQLRERLKSAAELDQGALMELHSDFGKHLAECAIEFMARNDITETVDLICSHGHTVLHNPDAGYTLQIGSGAQLAALTGLPVVSDLRSKDVALGGQGAPIVPIGERHLFPQYQLFLNIGGIANVSYHGPGGVKAYDVCPGNTPLNLLARQHGSEYDEGGSLARSGVLLPELMSRLKQFSFYSRPIPRSLHTDLIVSEMMPMIDLFPGSLKDKMHTVCEHLAMEISHHANELHPHSGGEMLITGGGAWNNYLLERIRHYCHSSIVIPDDIIINYKEALVMAFFGILRWRGEVNCLASVTGASRDSTGGTLWA